MTEATAPGVTGSRRYRVLLVEDDEQHAVLARLWLDGDGAGVFDVIRADRLSTALAALEAGSVDAVLLDLSLPDSDRLATFRAVRQRVPFVPVVLMTGLGDQQLALQAVAEGAQDYLVKGDIDGRLLVRALHYAIARQRADQAERRLLEAQRLESLSVLAGGLAHQLNNLLLVMTGNLGLALQDLPPGTGVRRYVAEADEAADRAAKLTRQLLAFSGRGGFVREPIAVNDVVLSVAASMQTQMPAGARLECAVAPVSPVVLGDQGQIAQLLVNLLANAAEAMAGRTGRVVVSTGVVQADDGVFARAYLAPPLPSGAYAAIEVGDEGEGIDAEVRTRIFEPFFTTRFTGRGLGLAAVHGIVRGHQGAVLVESVRGSGTKMRVLIPAAGQPARTDRQAPAAS